MKALTIDDRIITTQIDGDDHEFLLSTWATSEITKKFGGIEKLGDVLTAEDPEVLDKIFTLLVILANAAIQYRNLRAKEDQKKPLLENDYFMLRVSPFDVAGLKDIILGCLSKGLARNVESEEEDSGKNAPTA